MSVKAVPDEVPTVMPTLIVRGAAKALEFYVKALGAKETARIPGPDGKIMHSTIEIGTSVIMVHDEFPEMGALSPESVGGSPCYLYTYFENVDDIAERAVKLGAKLKGPVEDQFYGDRVGHLEDPFGHNWTLASHVEDMTEEEIGRRMAEMTPSN